jgi:hypothetical protein
MLRLKIQSKTALRAVAAMLLFAAMAPAQIAGLCNTGQTPATTSGCTAALVPPNPADGGPNRDGNWEIAFPYPSILSPPNGRCEVKNFVKSWVDTLDIAWLANSASIASEWTTPYDGEDALNAAGWYVYRTKLPVPAVLASGRAPTGVTVNGQLTSDNATFWIYLESPAYSGRCSLVSGQAFPVNPPGSQTFSDFQQWWPFSFTNSTAIAPGADAYLYLMVQNAYDRLVGGPSNTGLRGEFFATSSFH